MDNIKSVDNEDNANSVDSVQSVRSIHNVNNVINVDVYIYVTAHAAINRLLMGWGIDRVVGRVTDRLRRS